MYTVGKYFLLFIIFSVVGWVYESILCSIEQKKFVNRGFLNGPYCPIYGAGALLDVLALCWLKNPFLLFILGALLCCSIEYVTSFVLEKLFHARWWDYSKRKFNIKGRICLIGAVVFGLFSVVLIMFLYPFVWNIIESLNKFWLFLVCIFSFSVLLSDIIVTIIGFAGFEEKLKTFTSFIEEKKKVFVENLKRLKFIKGKKRFAFKGNFNSVFSSKLNVKKVGLVNRKYLVLKESGERFITSSYSEYSGRLTVQQRRMLRAFPQFKSIRYENAVAKIKDFYKKLKEQRLEKKAKKEKFKKN